MKGGANRPGNRAIKRRSLKTCARVHDSSCVLFAAPPESCSPFRPRRSASLPNHAISGTRTTNTETARPTQISRHAISVSRNATMIGSKASPAGNPSIAIPRARPRSILNQRGIAVRARCPSIPCPPSRRPNSNSANNAQDVTPAIKNAQAESPMRTTIASVVTE